MAVVISKRRGLFFLPILLSFTSSLFLFLFISSTSKPDILQPAGLTRIHVINPLPEFSTTTSPVMPKQSIVVNRSLVLDLQTTQLPSRTTQLASTAETKVETNDDDDIFHDRSFFTKDYKQMNKTLKIYAYPHDKDDPFANVLLPVNSEPTGNYASESYFKNALFESHFLTNDPSEADLFYLPFSIASLRHDKRVGVGGIKDFVANYVDEISRSYPFWNRSGGADHFYVACHSVGRTAMEKAVGVKLNAIQVVCSSSYFLSGYVAHKDASIPQIWPRKGVPPTRSPSQRKTLAFYAGAMNSRVRKDLVKTWENDSDISVHYSRLQTLYSEALLGSKFCIHAKGFEVNTARIGDALYYGCVPVVLADYYDLPYSDVINWNRFSVVLSAADIPMLKKILEGIVNRGEYLRMQRNVMRVQKHFQWHDLPLDFDAFYMVMYELWLRRSHVRIT
ncbi:hypothetical protein ABFX02_10G067800 [Erythranthe guttata]